MLNIIAIHTIYTAYYNNNYYFNKLSPQIHCSLFVLRVPIPMFHFHLSSLTRY